jgi:hypothetical protein
MATRSTIHDAKTVAEAAFDVLRKEHPDWSDETLLYHPVEAQRLCKSVRRRTGKRLDDDQILRAMVNARKRGKVKREGRVMEWSSGGVLRRQP